MNEAIQRASVLTEFGPADWIAFASLFLTILGGVVSIVWQLSRLQARVEELIGDVASNTDHRSQCDRERAILAHTVESQRERIDRHGEVLTNHADRMSAIEIAIHKGGG